MMSPPESPVVPAPPALPWAPILGIVAATAAAYAVSLSAPLIYDDHIWITWNPSIQHLSRLGSVLAPTEPAVRGRPVLSLSLALNYALGGEGARGYHAANLAIHALAALALFGIVRRTLARLPGAFLTERDRTMPALFAALLWAVHPLQTEAVTYVVQRAESLMGLFYLLTLYCFIRGVEPGGGRVWRLLCVLACLLGMATKEVMVTAPLLVLAYDRTFAAGSFRGALLARGGFYAGLAATWLVLVFQMAGLAGRGVGYGLGYTWWSYALVESWVVVHYLMLSLWPFPLVFDYGTHLLGSVAESVPWACLLLALVAATLLLFRRRPALGFAGVWFLLILAPGSSVVPVAFQPMAEHRMYLPLASVTTLLSVGAWLGLGRRATPVLAALALALGTLTAFRNYDYRSEISLWGDTVRRRPSNERAHLALGSALALAGRDSEAAEQFTDALRIEPWDFEARRNLGLALFHMGRAEEALRMYRGIVTPTPDSAPLHYDTALALEGLGRTEEAIEEFQRALRIDPGDGEARNNLGGVLFRSGRVDEAIYQYETALRSRADPALIHFNLGMAIASKGGIERSMQEYREAIRLDPGYAEAHNNLGYTLYQLGRNREAIEEFEAALRIRPGYPMARASLELLRRLEAGPPAPR